MLTTCRGLVLKQRFVWCALRSTLTLVDDREKSGAFLVTTCSSFSDSSVCGSAAADCGISIAPPKSVPKLMSELKIAKSLYEALGEGEWGQAQARSLERLNIKLSPHRVNLVLKRLGANEAMAWGFFNWAAQQAGYIHTSQTFYAMLKLFGSSGNVKSVEMLLDKMRREGCLPDVAAYNVLLKCYGKLWKVKEALRVMADLQSHGCPPNKETYNSILKSLTRQRYHHEALGMYKQMVLAGCRPTNHTHAVMIRSLAASGRIQDACDLFDRMLPEAKCPPSEVAYAAILEVHAKAGNVEQVENLFKHMKEARLTPDEATYRLVADLLRSAGKKDEADSVMWEMEYKHSGGRRRRGR